MASRPITRDRSRFGGIRRRLALALVGTGGIYVAVVAVSGLHVRPFEVLLLVWLGVLLPYATFRVDAVLASAYWLMASLLLSILVHGMDPEGLLLWLRLGVAVLLFVAVREGVGSDRAMFERAFHTWIGVGVLVALLGVVAWVLAVTGVAQLDFLLFRGASGFRAQSVVLDPNRFGDFAAITMVATFLRLLVAQARWKSWCLGFIIAAMGVLLSGSRGALLSGAAAITLIGGLQFITGKGVHRRRMVSRSLVLALTLATVLTATGAWVYLGELRLLATNMGSDSLASNIRFRFLQIVLNRVTDSPTSLFFGSGDYGSIELSAGPFSPHNTYLAVLSAQGVIGLSLYLAVAGFLLGGVARLVVLRRADDETLWSMRLALLGGMVSMLIHMNSTVLYTTGFAWVYMGLFASSARVRRIGGGNHPSAVNTEARVRRARPAF